MSMVGLPISVMKVPMSGRMEVTMTWVTNLQLYYE
jgi:hypothetical protein